jgi:predicted nucleic acid-binding protein
LKLSCICKLWQQTQPPHDPEEAGEAVRLLVEPPSMIRILSDNQEVAIRMLKLAASHQLRARRVHDARHAAAAIVTGIGIDLAFSLRSRRRVIRSKARWQKEGRSNL